MASCSAAWGAALPTSMRSASRGAGVEQPGLDAVVVDDHVADLQRAQAAHADQVRCARTGADDEYGGSHGGDSNALGA